MILFLNVFITDTTIPLSQGNPYKRANRTYLNTYSNLDIFKYSLASLSKAYNWKRVILKVLLDENYLHRKEELNTFINNEFKDIPLNLFWTRNTYQHEWQETYDLFDDELIWFSCNHDHIFLDSSQDYLNLIIKEMRKEADTPISFCYTHWPEQISYLCRTKSPQDLVIHDEYATINLTDINSINVISKSIYKMWWFSTKLDNKLQFPRPDWGANMLNWFVDCGKYQKNFISFKELNRHFDAYYHIDMHQCPALNIPDGFFDKNIKLSIGNPDRIEGYTWLNPTIEKYGAENKNGVDYKWCEEDIPIGWKDRISDIKVFPHDDNWYESRIKSIADMLYNNYNDRIILDTETLNKIINVWIKPYGLTTE